MHRKPISVLFWFNRDLESPWTRWFAARFEYRVTSALAPIRDCIGSIRYDSANLTDAEDHYPRGPTVQWYDLFQAPSQPLKGLDYFFWYEHDVFAIRHGWMDALVSEVTFRGDFYIKGSVHRGSRLVGKESSQWIAHINGNALYRANDQTFNALVAQCYKASAGVDDFLASFDVALWTNLVTAYGEQWAAYQGYAHKIQHTEFIQSYCDDLSKDKLMEILDSSPTTYFIHGSSSSKGEQLRKQLVMRAKQREKEWKTSQQAAERAKIVTVGAGGAGEAAVGVVARR